MSADQQDSLTPAKPAAGSAATAPKTPGALADELSRLDFPIPPQFSLTESNNKKKGGHARQQSSVGGAASGSAGLGLPQGTMPGGLEQVGPSPAERQNDGGADGEDDDQELADRLANLPLGEPERLSQQASHRRKESVSDQLTDELAKMDFPRPERIFGADDPVSPTSAQSPSMGESGRFSSITGTAANDTPNPGGQGKSAGPSTTDGTPRVGIDASEWYSVQLPQGQEIPEALRRGSLQGVQYRPQQQQLKQGQADGQSETQVQAAAAAT